MSNRTIKGFYKLSREEKVKYLVETNDLNEDIKTTLNQFLHPTKQQLFDDFSENIISNYLLPYSIAPNFLINNEMYTIPMVIEESSVVAAASKAASFWAQNGGFHYQVIDTEKVGQIFFEFNGSKEQASIFFEEIKLYLEEAIDPIQHRMRTRGGGLSELFLIEHQPHMGNIFEIQATFETADSMGANFINSCLEKMKEVLNLSLEAKNLGSCIMAILSNHTPNCVVKCWVECPIEELAKISHDIDVDLFVKRFSQAIHIAKTDKYRATTHNKGIFNGIDAVVLATGNDFRAVEAAGHAFASRRGSYHSLTSLQLVNNRFKYTLEIPLSLGVTGGQTSLHPLANVSLQILGHPSAHKLMGIAASVGLANNFSAISSLITSGIQRGHMKLHLQNILNSLGANDQEKEATVNHFHNKTVSYNDVTLYINKLRCKNG